jgi:hypothetical protein
MPGKAPQEPQSARRPVERVAAPPTQAKAKRLSPTHALAWLNLIPNSVFPIRSRDDMAAKISALLFSGPSPEEQGVGHKLPAGTRHGSRKKSGAS